MTEKIKSGEWIKFGIDLRQLLKQPLNLPKRNNYCFDKVAIPLKKKYDHDRFIIGIEVYG